MDTCLIKVLSKDYKVHNYGNNYELSDFVECDGDLCNQNLEAYIHSSDLKLNILMRFLYQQCDTNMCEL